MDITKEALLAAAGRALEIEIPDYGDDAKKKAWAKRRAAIEKLDEQIATLQLKNVQWLYEELYGSWTHDTPEYLLKDIVRDQIRERMMDVPAVVEIGRIVEGFDAKVKLAGKNWSYDAKKFGDSGNLFIAIYRTSGKFPEELHLIDANGSWAGPGVTIYTADRRSYGEDEIKPAYVGASSSQLESTEHARAQATMIIIAAELADLYTKRDMPFLVYEQGVAKAHRERRQAETDAKRAREQAFAADLERVVAGEEVRLTAKSRKTPLVGKLLREDATGTKFFMHVAWKDEPLVVRLNDIVKVERKENGRYVEMEPRIVKEEL